MTAHTATAQTATRKRYSLLVLAMLLLLLAGAALFLGSHNIAIRALGSLGCLVSVYLVRISKVYRPDQRTETEATTRRPGV